MHKEEERAEDQRTSSVSDSQVVSSLQLHIQLVHLRGVGGRLRRAPRGGGRPHNLLGTSHVSVTNSEVDLSIATKPIIQEDLFFFFKGIEV